MTVRRPWMSRRGRRARVAVVVTATVAALSSVAPGAAAGQREEAVEAELPNAVALKVGWATHLLRERDSQVPGEQAPEIDQLGGFVLSYSRVLVPGAVRLTVAKPFFFADGRFDSPLEVLLSVGARVDRFELSAGFGPVLNLRVFEGERERIEGRRLEVSMGLAVAAAVAYLIGPTWFLELEAAYAYQVGDPVVSHEIELVLGPGLLF